jgi:hypothetical protein
MGASTLAVSAILEPAMLEAIACKEALSARSEPLYPARVCCFRLLITGDQLNLEPKKVQFLFGPL